MCMISIVQNEKEIATNIVYKVLVKDGKSLRTPFQKTPIISNKLTALGEPVISSEYRPEFTDEELKMVRREDLFEGAIHCCRTIQTAKYWLAVVMSHKWDEPKPNASIYKACELV